MYKVPRGTCSGEQLLNILLDDDIDVRRVCCERPMQIAESSTFVVDLNSIEASR